MVVRTDYLNILDQSSLENPNEGRRDQEILRSDLKIVCSRDEESNLRTVQWTPSETGGKRKARNNFPGQLNPVFNGPDIHLNLGVSSSSFSLITVNQEYDYNRIHQCT
jgi:hypothetical protein